MSTYKAAFLIPKKSEKVLENTGWVFYSEDRLSDLLVLFLIEELKLEFVNEYLDMSCYKNESLKATVVYDKERRIEHIYFQIFKEIESLLVKVFQSRPFNEDTELFIPSEHRTC